MVLGFLRFMIRICPAFFGYLKCCMITVDINVFTVGRSLSWSLIHFRTYKVNILSRINIVLLKNKRKRTYLELKLKATKNTTFLKPKKLQKEVSKSSCLQKKKLLLIKNLFLQLLFESFYEL